MQVLSNTPSKSLPFNVEAIRADFPILKQMINGKPLVYLDNSATTQKPQVMIDALSHFYATDNANVHRGVHTLSQRATGAFEEARVTVQSFIHAAHAHEIIFTKGTTEGINLVAHSLGESWLNAGDEIIISAMEHHANIVPWQRLVEKIGCVLRVIPMTQQGELILTDFEALITSRTKLVSVTYASNVLGTLNPVAEMIEIAHRKNIPVLIDAAQAAAHIVLDVQELACDFLVLSAHKMYGPTGVGILYARSPWLEKMSPYQTGGNMIREVTFERTTFAAAPYKFEAGTPNIADVIAWAATLRYLQNIGFQAIIQHEHHLLLIATEALQRVPGLRIIGTAKNKLAVISFVLADIHPHDIGTVLDHEGIAVRAGHHCAMPMMDFFQVPATVRASFGLYNTSAEIMALVEALQFTQRLFR